MDTLRPNSYDITSLNYKEGYKIYFNNKNILKKKDVKFKFSKKQISYIQNFLKKINLKLMLINLLSL
jgi:hypothetical protein